MLPNKRILIVDDEEDLRFVLAQSIELLGSGYQAVTVSNGYAALIRLQEQPFDLVMTDFHMPGMTGLELAQVMAQIAPNVPVVLMTGDGNVKLRDTIEQMGMTGYLRKPFGMEQVHGVVKRILECTDSKNL